MSVVDHLSCPMDAWKGWKKKCKFVNHFKVILIDSVLNGLKHARTLVQFTITQFNEGSHVWDYVVVQDFFSFSIPQSKNENTNLLNKDIRNNSWFRKTCLRSAFDLICRASFWSALFSQREFISLEAIRALWISAHQMELMDGMNPGAGPRNGS